jgi:hypothetical protein
MRRFFRLSLIVAAAISVAAAPSMTSPALAREAPQPTTVTKPSVMKRHALWRGSGRMVHRAVRQYDSRYAPIVSQSQCAGVWCGRQFVLMIGVGF